MLNAIFIAPFTEFEFTTLSASRLTSNCRWAASVNFLLARRFSSGAAGGV